MSMSPQDWEDLGRVLRAGAARNREYTYNNTRQHDAAVLERMAAECEAIASERKHPENPEIACADCNRLRPGPGVLSRTHSSARRICAECAEKRNRPFTSLFPAE